MEMIDLLRYGRAGWQAIEPLERFNVGNPVGVICGHITHPCVAALSA
jgi:hypothetical protein